MAQTVTNLPALRVTQVTSLSWEDPLEKRMATHSSILAWRVALGRGARQAIVPGVSKSDTTEVALLSLFHLLRDNMQK